MTFTMQAQRILTVPSRWFWWMVPLSLALGIWGGTMLGGPGSTPVVIENPREQDGIAARGGNINIMGTRTGTSNCPAATQRYLWRQVIVDGRPVGELVPLPFTAMPALLPNGDYMLTLPVPANLDEGKWFYRAVTVETCPWVPSWLGGQTVRRSPDIPIEVKG